MQFRGTQEFSLLSKPHLNQICADCNSQHLLRNYYSNVSQEQGNQETIRCNYFYLLLIPYPHTYQHCRSRKSPQFTSQHKPKILFRQLCAAPAGVIYGVFIGTILHLLREFCHEWQHHGAFKEPELVGLECNLHISCPWDVSAVFDTAGRRGADNVLALMLRRCFITFER